MLPGAFHAKNDLSLNARLCDYPAMTRFRARLSFFAIMAIFVATASNALLMQDRGRLFQGSGLPSTAVSVTQFPLDKASQLASEPSSRLSPAKSRTPKGLAFTPR